MYKLMTPGPTQVREDVLAARALPFKNPDIDVSFVEEYKELCLEISALLGTENETLILGGEGILGLEAACASLIERGDKVLVVDNGIFGRGFADFVEMYGGIPTLYTTDYQAAVDVTALEAYLAEHHDFKIATVVHGDTPSGILNDVDAITAALKKYDILTIVDAVSTMFGEKLSVDNIDILCGGSQKVISAPPGLTLNIVSPKAKEVICNRKTPIASFYANLKVFFSYYEEKWFPYTMPASDINGLKVAIDNIKNDPDIYDRHAKVGAAVRHALKAAGLKLHLKNGFANTVSVFEVPEGTTAQEIIDTVREDHDILITGSFGHLAGKVIRLGHMGNNADREAVRKLMAALDQTFAKLGIKLNASLENAYSECIF